ncbi:hypothetical protein SDC9_202661 [bioreactor metagenome]|uniref:Uncharacterized protein n=1 Tax=bioreactor metagenome TaxID=1076179 RepID=A0A645IVU8_9ZZZZ
MLEAHRDLVALFAEGSRQLVEHMRGGHVAYHRALPALVLVQVVVEHHQDLIGRDVAAVRVDDAQAVAVAVKGDAHVIAPRGHLAAQLMQALLAGCRHQPAKVGVPV